MLKYIGYKKYKIEIIWLDSQEVEIVEISAFSPTNAIIKLSKLKDVVNKATMKVLK